MTIDVGTSDSSGASESAGDQLVGADRVLAILRELARHPDGIGLDELARIMGSPKSTVHRALAALRRASFATLDGPGRYALSDEFLRIAFAHHDARPDHVRVAPVLRDLAARFAETTHYAVLDGRSVVYRAKVDPPAGGVRLTSTVGGRNPAHATAVGKLLLAYAMPDMASLAAWAGDEPLVHPTANTFVTIDDLWAELVRIRARGYSTDDQENEPQINCVALPVFLTSPAVPSGALSISALAFRTPLSQLIDDLPEIRSIIDEHGIATGSAAA